MDCLEKLIEGKWLLIPLAIAVLNCSLLSFSWFVIVGFGIFLSTSRQMALNLKFGKELRDLSILYFCIIWCMFVCGRFVLWELICVVNVSRMKKVDAKYCLAQWYDMCQHGNDDDFRLEPALAETDPLFEKKQVWGFYLLFICSKYLSFFTLSNGTLV